MKQRWFVLCLMVVLALPAVTLAAPPDVTPAGALTLPPDPPARFHVNVVVRSLQDFADLARRLPTYDEAFEAGQTRLNLTQAEIDGLRQLGYAVDVLGAAPAQPDAWPSCYSKLADLNSWLASYAAANPNLIELSTYGSSWCLAHGGCTNAGGQTIAGYSLQVARITNELGAPTKAGRFFVDGGLHARELPGPELMKTFIQTLVSGYGVDPNLTWLLDNREVYVVLESNPDGRRMVELGTEPPYNSSPWYWRKNTNNSAAGSGSCSWPPNAYSHYGIDLNRNHIFKWDVAGGGSTAPCDQTYRGVAPGSEPEIQAYETLVRSLIPDQRGPGDTDPAPATTTGLMINIHNYTDPGSILVPWGWTTALPPNNTELMAIGNKFNTLTGSTYDVSHALYPVSGNTRDWGYGELGVPAYVIELYGDDFFTSCSLVPSVINTMLPVLKYAAAIADRPYQRAFGPDAGSLAVLPGSVVSGYPFNLTAQINDTQNGNQAIAGAEYYLMAQGAAPVGDPGTGGVMTAVDGTFNSPIEGVKATVSTNGLAAGRYLALVRGRDSLNNWGPLGAQWMTICSWANVNCSANGVDVLDIQLTAQAVQDYWSEGTYTALYDVDFNGAGDGDLDVIDILTVAAYFGTTGP